MRPELLCHHSDTARRPGEGAARAVPMLLTAALLLVAVLVAPQSVQSQCLCEYEDVSVNLVDDFDLGGNPIQLEDNAQDGTFFDVDNDGDQDLVVSREPVNDDTGLPQTNLIYLNQGSLRPNPLPGILGVFRPTLTGESGGYNLPFEDTRETVLGFINLDSFPDAVIVQSPGGVPGPYPNRLYFGTDPGSDPLGLNQFVEQNSSLWQELVPPYPEQDSFDVTIADYDGDGDQDIFIGTLDRSEANRIWRWDSARFIPIDVPFHSGFDFRNGVLDAEFADINGDGYLDLILATQAENWLVLNHSDVNPNDPFPVTFNGNPNWFDIHEVDDNTQDITVADIDGDGDPDIIAGNGGNFPNCDIQDNNTLSSAQSRFNTYSESAPRTLLL